MPYEVPSNQPQTAYKGGKTIIASRHMQYTEEGGTLDAALIGNRYVELGEPFVRDNASGRYVPFVDATHTTTGTLNAGFSDPVICNVDFNCDGSNNVIVGELLIRASVYSAKLPAKVTAAFKGITPNIRYVTRGL